MLMCIAWPPWLVIYYGDGLALNMRKMFCVEFLIVPLFDLVHLFFGLALAGFLGIISEPIMLVFLGAPTYTCKGKSWYTLVNQVPYGLKNLIHTN